MREENWNKMLMISAALHLIVLAALSFPVSKTFRKYDASKSYYSVNLVGDIGPGLGSAAGEKSRSIPAKQPEVVKPQKGVQKKTRPTPTRETKDTRTLAPKKTEKEKPQGTTENERESVEEKIRRLKQTTGSSTVAGKGTGAAGNSDVSVPGPAGAGGRLIDPALARYLVGVREKIETTWHIPFISSQKKNLEVNATIKIRKDGRIVDIAIDKRSGNRVYDESVVRVLRMIDPLPPLPSSVTEDPLEVELTLRPEGVS
jgi:colicin import membrane protein